MQKIGYHAWRGFGNYERLVLKAWGDRAYARYCDKRAEECTPAWVEFYRTESARARAILKSRLYALARDRDEKTPRAEARKVLQKALNLWEAGDE